MREKVELVSETKIPCRRAPRPRASLLAENGKYLMVAVDCAKDGNSDEIGIFDTQTGKTVRVWDLPREGRRLQASVVFLRSGNFLYAISIQPISPGSFVHDDGICVDRFDAVSQTFEHMPCFGEQAIGSVNGVALDSVNQALVLWHSFFNGERRDNQIFLADLTSENSNDATLLSFSDDAESQLELSAYRFETVDFSEDGRVLIFFRHDGPSGSPQRRKWLAASFDIVGDTLQLAEILGRGDDVVCKGWLGQNQILASPWHTAPPPDPCVIPVVTADVDAAFDAHLFAEGFEHPVRGRFIGGWRYVEASRSSNSVVLYSDLVDRLEIFDLSDPSRSSLIECYGLKGTVCGDVFSLNAKGEFAHVVGNRLYRYRLKQSAP
ncbi:hypothetical protein [Ponticaulis profundi]|uniref:Uncharacterized protein n=1 Tax=Ponticaulis profundi TaxID=2665222 RepID=A0ABW1SBJ9_9PROT